MAARARCGLAGLTTALLLAAGCGDGGGSPSDAPVRVVVTPGVATLEVDQSVQLAAEALDSDDQPVSGVAFTWASTNLAVVTVSPAGLVTGVAPGSAGVTATGGGKVGAATITVTSPAPSVAVLLAAGDIAQCSSGNDEATAAILDTIPGTVAVLGDNAYDDGSLVEYTDCYGPSWGRHKARTHPSAGNHEYQTAGAAGYWAYWGASAGVAGQGYYSYDLGAWHIVALNSNCAEVSCAAGSAQEQWLRADLAAHPNACTLAYWHHPRFSSGAAHGDNPAVGPLWQALYEAGAELVLNGHEHLYERFAPQTPLGVADPAAGIRQFTVGTGGKGLYQVGTLKANSQVVENGTFGVLKLTLAAGGYTWEFVAAAGGAFTDSGTGSCH